MSSKRLTKNEALALVTSEQWLSEVRGGYHTTEARKALTALQDVVRKSAKRLESFHAETGLRSSALDLWEQMKEYKAKGQFTDKPQGRELELRLRMNRTFIIHPQGNVSKYKKDIGRFIEEVTGQEDDEDDNLSGKNKYRNAIITNGFKYLESVTDEFNDLMIYDSDMAVKLAKEVEGMTLKEAAKTDWAGLIHDALESAKSRNAQARTRRNNSRRYR